MLACFLQVHRAKLWTGESVAVKVQYPGLTAAVTADLTVLTGLARVAEWLFPDGFRFGWVVAELRRNLAAELDFRVEAANSERLRASVGSCTSVVVPSIVPEVCEFQLQWGTSLFVLLCSVILLSRKMTECVLVWRELHAQNFAVQCSK